MGFGSTWPVHAAPRPLHCRQCRARAHLRLEARWHGGLLGRRWGRPVIPTGRTPHHCQCRGFAHLWSRPDGEADCWGYDHRCQATPWAGTLPGITQSAGREGLGQGNDAGLVPPGVKPCLLQGRRGDVRRTNRDRRVGGEGLGWGPRSGTHFGNGMRNYV